MVFCLRPILSVTSASHSGSPQSYSSPAHEPGLRSHLCRIAGVQMAHLCCVDSSPQKLTLSIEILDFQTHNNTRWQTAFTYTTALLSCTHS